MQSFNALSSKCGTEGQLQVMTHILLYKNNNKLKCLKLDVIHEDELLK